MDVKTFEEAVKLGSEKDRIGIVSGIFTISSGSSGSNLAAEQYFDTLLGGEGVKETEMDRIYDSFAPEKISGYDHRYVVDKGGWALVFKYTAPAKYKGFWLYCTTHEQVTEAIVEGWIFDLRPYSRLEFGLYYQMKLDAQKALWSLHPNFEGGNWDPNKLQPGAHLGCNEVEIGEAFAFLEPVVIEWSIPVGEDDYYWNRRIINHQPEQAYCGKCKLTFPVAEFQATKAITRGVEIPG